MPRNMITKQVTTTTVNGFEIVDGQPREVSYQINKSMESLTRAQDRIRKDHPSFSVVNMTHNKITYGMPWERFIEVADVIDTNEE